MLIQTISLIIILFCLWWVGKQVYQYFWGQHKLPVNACPTCEGKGYWLATRGREPCHKCRGTGIKQ